MSYPGHSERPLVPMQPSPPDASTSVNLQQTSGPTHKPKRVACKECRQAKLRCDGQGNEARNPCARCRRMSLPCQIDTAYKRVNKRLKINELAEEVERLRSAVGQRGTEAPNNSIQSGASATPSCYINGNDQHVPVPSLQPPSLPQQSISSAQYQSPSTRLVSSDPLSFSAPPPAGYSRSLDYINLDRDRINGLFRIFFENYHPFFDILEATVSPDEYYSRSPFLFWSIITIAARQYPNDATLFAKLTPCVIKIMWNAISTLPHNRFIIQAILLLSIWSFPTNSMSTDPSFILVSIAKSASMQLGLHRPEIIQDFMRVKTQLSSSEFQEAVKTWVGGFIAAQSVTASIGQLTLVQADWVIETACMTSSKYTIPENLRNHLLISKFITRINSLIAEDKRSEAGYPLDRDICVLINVLEQDFIELEVNIGRSLSEIHQILLIMSSLQLRTYYFFISTSQDIRRQGILKAYTTSLYLISKVTEANETWEFIKYAPDEYSQFLVLAAVLIMRIIHSTYSKYINIEEGNAAFDKLLWMFRKASVENDDLRGRISKILTQLWSFHQSRVIKSIQEEPKLNIKTRLGASLLHDSLWTWREEFGGQRDVVRAAVPNASNEKVLTDSERSSACNSNINTENQDSLAPHIVPQHTFDPANPAPFEEPNFNFEVQDMDWLWDVGFPSFLPMDFNSYEP